MNNHVLIAVGGMCRSYHLQCCEQTSMDCNAGFFIPLVEILYSQDGMGPKSYVEGEGHHGTPIVTIEGPTDLRWTVISCRGRSMKAEDLSFAPKDLGGRKKMDPDDFGWKLGGMYTRGKQIGHGIANTSALIVFWDLVASQTTDLHVQTLRSPLDDTSAGAKCKLFGEVLGKVIEKWHVHI